MAKREAKIIHPVQLIESLAAYKDDANNLLTISNFVLDLMNDGTVGEVRAMEVMKPKLESAVARMRRWNEAEVD